MKTRFCLLLVAMALAAVAAGCSEGDARTDDSGTPAKEIAGVPAKDDISPELMIAATDFALGSVPGDATEIRFEVNVDWTVSVEYDGEQSGWLAVAPESGRAGKAELALKADANPDAAVRKAFIRIAYGNEVQRLTVVQDAAKKTDDDPEGDPDPEAEPKLELHTTVAYEDFYAHEAYEEKIAFWVNNDWTVTVEDVRGPHTDWFSVTPMSGTAGEIELALSVSKNPSSDNRSAKIRIQYGAKFDYCLVYVYQRGMNLAYVFDKEFSRQLERRGYIRNTNQIAPDEVKGITYLNLMGAWSYSEERYLGTLTSLKGIEYFESLEHLNCWGNQLTSLDVSRNKALKELWCYNNSLTSLDVSGCPVLEVLYCHSNPLTTLDVSRNPALTSVNCYNMQLTSLDVSHNPALVQLSLDKNFVSSLDVSHNPVLRMFDCSYNNLPSLDISRNPEMTQMKCDGNPGDGTVFPICSWFDEHAIPTGIHVHFTTEGWRYGGREITPDYRKVE